MDNANKSRVDPIADIRAKVPRMLSRIQVLFQHGEIDVATRNRLAMLIQKGIASNPPDWSELHKLIQHLSFSTTMPSALSELLSLTTQNN